MAKDTELLPEVVKKRAISGIVTLTGRNVVLQIFGFLGGTILLPLLVSKEEYGTFILLSAFINFFIYFSDIGLAAALIQKKDKPSQADLKTTFTIQQLLVLLAVIIVFSLTPLLTKFYKLSPEGVVLLWSLVLSFVFSSLKTIPSILLERKLEFGKWVIPQIIEVFIFNTVAVFLAWRGFGITSYTIAVILRGLSGLIFIYILSPWKPGIFLSKSSVKELLKFGLPYQVNTFLAMIKDDGMTILLGGLLGPGGIGLLGWAKRWGEAPLRFFMDQVIKVTFPAFSRLQNNPQTLEKALSRSLFFICLFVFPSLVVLAIIAPELTNIFTKYKQWQPALFALTLFSVNSAIAGITTPLTNMLNATGKIKTTFKLMVMWTILTWITIPFLATKYGVNGAAIGSLVVGSSSFIAIWIAYKQVKFDLIYSIGKPLISATGMLIALKLISPIFPQTLIGTVSQVLFGLVVYGSSIFLTVGPSISQDFRKVLNAVLKK